MDYGTHRTDSPLTENSSVDGGTLFPEDGGTIGTWKCTLFDSDKDIYTHKTLRCGQHAGKGTTKVARMPVDGRARHQAQAFGHATAGQPV
jgi:hypothetical protein